MSLVSLFSSAGPSGFGARSTAEEVTLGRSLEGKTYLLTGSTSGLGLETLRVLSLRGARVLATGRTQEKAQAASAQVSATKAQGLALELADPKSVRACVEAVKRDGATLDGIICNAGIMALPKRETAFGYELQFFTNHVGHFMLVTGLLERLADDGRIVVLSSAAHTRAPTAGIEFDNLSGEVGYTAWRAYGHSKLANLLFVRELARRLEGTRKTANAVHPGVIATKLSRHMNPVVGALFAATSPLFLKTPGEGAATQCFVATHPSLAQVSGRYFADCNLKQPRADAEDAVMAKRLWEKTEEIVRALPT
jgi:NAD(P)-dependent dehydrogenase (short-subunit alcohol dehydrogenase family)